MFAAPDTLSTAPGPRPSTTAPDPAPSATAPVPATSGAGVPRLHFVDWYRGIACVLMFQTHALDSWLAPAHRNSQFWWTSRHLGGIPARLFLFLAGLSLMLSYRARLQRSAGDPSAVRWMAARRGLELLGIALAFRVGLWLLAGAPLHSIDHMLRVDILNCMGVSMMLAAVLCPPTVATPAAGRAPGGLALRVALPLMVALGIVALTPGLWGRWPPAWLPAPLAAYVAGSGSFAMFPLFPWAAYLLVGCAVGALLLHAHDRGRLGRTLLLCGVAGGAFIALGLQMRGRLPLSSFGDNVPGLAPHPATFVYRTGLCLLGLFLAYLITRKADRKPGAPSWLRELGTSSLLVYVVHVEMVYGKLSGPIKKRLAPWSATLLVIVLTVLMHQLAVFNRRRKERRRALAASAAGSDG